MQQSDWQTFDQQHIWHPYTSMSEPLPTFPVVAAKGVYLELADGRRLIDGMSSWWAAIHGYNHPRLNAAITQQLDAMAHVMFGGLTHSAAIELAEKLLSITDESLQHVFFADSGSVAVEVSIKMAIQYYAAQGLPAKQKLLTVRGGYHGDTFGAMAVCDPINGMHRLFENVLAQHFFAEKPLCEAGKPSQASIESFKNQLAQHHQEIAAVILEPIVQGAGGMHFYCAEYLQIVRTLCDEYNVLLILDEIATGFGRTGTLFAYEYANICPDILCVGKALTGGYLSLAATLTNKRVAKGIGQQALMHGPTFMANPLACQVACASIDLLLESDWQMQVKSIETQLQHGLKICETLPQVAEVRVKGAIGVVELKQAVNMADIQPKFVEQGVWLRPFGKLIYMMPPFIIKKNELDKIIQSVFQVISGLASD
jgi:adenosylmethionine-8-amino-7-oxononanoate aminotransferase